MKAFLEAFDGGASRTLIVLTIVASAVALAWHGTIDGQAFIGLVGGLLGAAAHASGTKQGSQAATADEKVD